MRAAVISFPGSNCDHDAVHALNHLGFRAVGVWHAERELPEADLIVLPGGFTYGDHLRTGAIAARSPVMAAVKRAAAAGVRVLGICNGFQVLTESGLLPGALLRNEGLHFVCRTVALEVASSTSVFTRGLEAGQSIRLPVAHGDGRYHADETTLDRLEGEGRVAFRYAAGDNPNGSLRDIAGITNEAGNVLGMMPHPERAVEPLLGGTDGALMLRGLLGALA